MSQTLVLMEKALQTRRAADWCKELNITAAAFSKAKSKGRLSPALAGCIATKLGENRDHWIAVAAIETEREGPLKKEMLKALLRHKP